jgi:hypothetical protein
LRTFGPADETADYTDKKDGADEEKQYQRRTEGSQSVPSAVKRTVTREPQVTRMKRMAQMNGNSISVEPKVRNLCASVSSVV